MSELRPLIDCRGLQEKLRVKRATADRIMRHCTVTVKVGRKIFVYEDEAAEVVKRLEVTETAA